MTLKSLDPSWWERVLVVMAHPDDSEYGLSSAVHSWTKRGIEVSYLLLTKGEAGMQRPPEEVGPLRSTEQRRACDTVGVGDLSILDHPDGNLVYGLELRRDIARKVREFRPDVVVTGNYELEAAWGLDQADHRAASLSTIDGARDASNRWIYREQIEGGFEPWSVSLLLLTGSVRPTHFVALEPDDEAAAIASLECHRAYLADLPWHPKPEEFIPEMLRGMGADAGVECAMAFQVYDLVGALATGAESDG